METAPEKEIPKAISLHLHLRPFRRPLRQRLSLRIGAPLLLLGLRHQHTLLIVLTLQTLAPLFASLLSSNL